ncbi:MAG TPA: hypothetical protein VGK51_05980 [Actinomycetota bacterium]
MHHRLEDHLARSVHMCARDGWGPFTLRSDTPPEPNLVRGRLHRLRDSHRQAGGRPDILLRKPRRWLEERNPRHCP